MKNKVILTTNVADLEINDEIVSTSSSSMRYYKVLEKPRLSKKKFYNGSARYIAVKCKTAMTIKTTTSPTGYVYNWKEYEFRVPEETDPIVKVDLNFKEILILNRE